MDTRTFNEIVKTRIGKTKALLLSKGSEYASQDRLSNFKDGASLQHCTPEQCLLGYVSKHIVATVKFIERKAKGDYVSEAQWDEKIGDIIVYMHLLEALVKEEDNG